MKLQIGLTIIFAGLLATTTRAQVFHYNFDDPTNGTSTVSIGSNTTTANFRNGANIPTDLHGATGSGVSGQATDLAFDNTASTGMGSTHTGGLAMASIGTAMDGIVSFTVSGWFKSDTAIGSAARLVEQHSGGTHFWRVSGSGSGQLALEMNTGTGTLGAYSTGGAGAHYTATDEWVFFAVTYDGTVTSNNVRFYMGGVTSSVGQVDVRSLNGGALGANAGVLSIGNAGDRSRPYDGFLDDFRIYGTTTGTGGVLNLEQLEAVRMAAIPEASTLALLLFPFVSSRLKRRKKTH